MKKYLLLLLTILILGTESRAQNASLGGVVNKYTAVTDVISSCKIRVKEPSKYSINDQVLIIQMKGADVDLSNTSNFGSVNTLNEAGKFEFNYIDTINGDTITLVYQLRSPDYDPDELMQMVFVPTYDVLNVTGTILPQSWDGEKGGVVVLEAKDSLVLFSDIDANGRGYRGGVRSTANYTCTVMNYSFSEFNNSYHGGYKGESFVRLNAQHITGRGAWATGGGGGNNHNTGGGGGGNFAAGGIGGKQSYVNSGTQGCNDTTTVNSGIGGYAFNYNNYKDRVFMGGGGGGGHQNDLVSGGGGQAGKGGNGGGIIILVTPKIHSFNRTIQANGQAVDSIAGRDGAGGGGAGGSVLLYTSAIQGSLTVQARGGRGGDNNSHNNLSFNLAATHGTGGGGGGGYVGVSSSSLYSNLSVQANGGRNGKILNSASLHYNLNYGAQPGSNGNVVTSLNLPRGGITACKITIVSPNNDQAEVTKNSSTHVKVKKNDYANRTTRVSVCQSPKNGIANVISYDSIYYEPNPNFVGDDSLTYCLCTTIQPEVCDSAKVYIQVTEVRVNAIKDQALTFINYPIKINVLGNDSINVPVTASLLSAPLFGNASWNGSTFDYSPGNNFTGIDSFRYRICSNTVPQYCDDAWVIVDVSVGVQCLNDFEQVQMGTPRILKPKANDQISLPTVLSILKAPSKGVAFTLNGDSISYAPQPGYYGFDTIFYKVCSFNPVTICDSAYIYIQVLPELAATDDAYTVNLSRNIRRQVTANDTIFGSYTIGIIKNPVHGSASAIGNDSILYTASPNFLGTDSLVYTICSGIVPGYCDTATVYYTITKQVTAVNDFTTTIEDMAVRIGVEGNDLFTEPTYVRVIRNPAKGFVSIDATDTVSYVPSPDRFGPDSFQYVLCTQAQPEVCDTAWVYLTITPRNDAPIAVFDTASTFRNRGILINVLANDVDPDGDPISFYLVSQPNVGTVRIEDTLMYFMPGTNYIGQDRFQYGVCDNQSPRLCDTTDVFVNVREREALEFHNGFSPNNDGVNDVWVIEGIESLNDYELLILNRWGNVVWKTTYYENNWKGVNLNDQPLPDGTYYFVLKILEEGKVEKGYLVIQRQ